MYKLYESTVTETTVGRNRPLLGGLEMIILGHYPFLERLAVCPLINLPL